MRRAFAAKIYVKGRHVRIALSRMAIEIVLNPNVCFFFEAHVPVPMAELEKHFSQFGQVYRCVHTLEGRKPINDDGEGDPETRSYGFVDFVAPEAAEMVRQEERSQRQMMLFYRLPFSVDDTPSLRL